MKETDKEYYARRGTEERKRAKTAASPKSRLIHDDIADLFNERASGSANVNSRHGIRPAPERPVEGDN